MVGPFRLTLFYFIVNSDGLSNIMCYSFYLGWVARMLVDDPVHIYWLTVCSAYSAAITELGYVWQLDYGKYIRPIRIPLSGVLHHLIKGMLRTKIVFYTMSLIAMSYVCVKLCGVACYHIALNKSDNWEGI